MTYHAIVAFSLIRRMEMAREEQRRWEAMFNFNISADGNNMGQINPMMANMMGMGGNNVMMGMGGNSPMMGMGGNNAMMGMGGNNAMMGMVGNNGMMGMGGNNGMMGMGDNSAMMGMGDNNAMMGMGGNNAMMGMGVGDGSASRGEDNAMAENHRRALNPSVWSEFAPGEGGGKRPRYPAEVFGRGGGGSGSGGSGSNRYGRQVAE